MNVEVKKAKREIRRQVRSAYAKLQYHKPWYISQKRWDKIMDALMQSL